MNQVNKQIKTKKNQQGFTLMEVMVVIVIIGMIGGAVVQNVMGSLDTAKISKVVQDIKGLETSLTMYKMDNYQYPNTEQGLEALAEETDVEPLPRRYPEGGYVKRLENDPWGNAYQLLNPGDNGDIDIFSMGPDGEQGTEDDIGNWNISEYQ
jgi:general secretion pathway protein G